MALKQITHSLPLEFREALLVQAGRGGDITSERHMYNLMNRRVPSCIMNGIVTAVGKDFIKVKDSDDRIHTIQIYSRFPLNGHVELNETPVVEIGTKVKAGTVVADNNFSKDKAIALGTNLRVAFMPYKGMNWKEALVISESAAKKISAVRFDSIAHDVQNQDIMLQETFYFLKMSARALTVKPWIIAQATHYDHCYIDNGSHWSPFYWDCVIRLIGDGAEVTPRREFRVNNVFN